MHLPHLNLIALLPTLGYAGVALILFLETGAFFGFFFPGDSLLFTAGLLASTTGVFNVVYLVLIACAAGILGDSVGYWFGAKVGPAIFTREDSLFFKKRYVEETHAFFEHYGTGTIILARFVPIVRTFAPILAGVGAMRYATFLRYNIIGGVLWAAGVTLLGYFLGATVPAVNQYLNYVIALIIVLSVLPMAYHYLRARRTY